MNTNKNDCTNYNTNNNVYNNNNFIRSWKRTIFQDIQEKTQPKKRQRTNGSFKPDNFQQSIMHPICINNAPESKMHNNANPNT